MENNFNNNRNCIVISIYGSGDIVYRLKDEKSISKFEEFIKYNSLMGIKFYSCQSEFFLSREKIKEYEDFKNGVISKDIYEKKIETHKKDRKTQEIVEKQERKQQEKTLQKINIIKNVLFFPFRMLRVIWNVVWIIFFGIPQRSMILLGIFRVILWFLVVLVLIPDGERDTTFGQINCYKGISQFMLQFLPQLLVEFVLIFAMGIISVWNFILSLMILGGFHTGLLDDSDAGYATRNTLSSFTTKYSNIAETLKFREGMLQQYSTTDKMNELSETAFITQENFEKLSQNPNTEEGIRFLEGMLNQQSTRGKYSYLKRMFGGKDKK